MNERERRIAELQERALEWWRRYLLRDARGDTCGAEEAYARHTAYVAEANWEALPQ